MWSSWSRVCYLMILLIHFAIIQSWNWTHQAYPNDLTNRKLNFAQNDWILELLKKAIIDELNTKKCTEHLISYLSEWVKSKEKEIYQLLNETPPNGVGYTKFIKHLTERENFWIKWKNDGCQKFMREKGSLN